MVPFAIQIDSSHAAKGIVMESETAAASFSFFGADRMVMRPGSERFGPVLPSSTGMQSNQMLICHSNQMGMHKSSPVPIYPAQLSREIYDMGSTLYNNMNFSATVNAPGAETAVPTKTSVPESLEKRCPTQDSLHYLGGNGEGILYPRSDSASDEAEDRQVIDVKKRKILSNRESARRSRLRKRLHLDALRAQVDHLRAENRQILNRINIAAQHYCQITEENSLLRSHALELIHNLQRLHHPINPQSHCAFKGMDTVTDVCTGAHLNTESGTIAQCFIESADILF